MLHGGAAVGTIDGGGDGGGGVWSVSGVRSVSGAGGCAGGGDTGSSTVDRGW